MSTEARQQEFRRLIDAILIEYADVAGPLLPEHEQGQAWPVTWEMEAGCVTDTWQAITRIDSVGKFRKAGWKITPHPASDPSIPRPSS